LYKSDFFDIIMSYYIHLYIPNMEINKFYTTKQIMECFNVSRDRVSKIARARGWRFSWIGRNKIYSKDDVIMEIKRRKELGLNVSKSNN